MINNTGVIEANSVGTKNGMIVLGAATAASKPAGLPTQTVKVSGTLSAAGKGQDEKGGIVQITGEAITLAAATIDASGSAGGGTVLIGGDTGGGNVNAAVAGFAKAQLQPWPVPTASTVSIDSASVISASAKDRGDGGKVIVWSDGATSFDGTILATGGPQSGSGGFAEVSGHQSLSFNGLANLGAAAGKAGTLLLDPENATIDISAGPGVVTVASVENALLTNNVVVMTGSSGSDPGDLTVAAPLSWSSAYSLSLSAYRNVDINANITNTGGAAVNLRADNTGTGVGTVTFGAGIQISTAGAVSIFYNPSVNPAGSGVNNTSYVNPVEDFSGNVTGGGSLTAYMLVNTVYDLQNIKNNLSGNYALGKDIDASGTATWNGGAGFVPLSPFSGILTGQNSNTFDGNNYTITGLTINAGTTPSALIGLFSFISSSGVARNLNLTNFAFTANGSNSRIGFLAATNTGTISQVSATGSFNTTSDGVMFGGLVASNFVGGTINGSSANVQFTGTGGLSAGVGGLVGQNIGTISQSSATGNVSGVYRVGGLVGFNSGTISQSYATGQTDNTSGGAIVGGLVGQNNGTITQSYARGQVGSGHPLISAGGLVGVNSGTISEFMQPALFMAADLAWVDWLAPTQEVPPTLPIGTRKLPDSRLAPVALVLRQSS